MAVASLSLFLLVLFTSFHGQLLVLSLDHDFSYQKFVYDAAEMPPPNKRYDYIIVGGGTAGCPLAATLSEKYSVLVLERGASSEKFPETFTADGYAKILTQEDTGKTPAERFTSEDGVDNLRGRVLGGTSMINGGVYSRADEEFIRFFGIDWNRNEVEQAYKWVEDALVSRPNPGTWQNNVKNSMYWQAQVNPDNGYTLDHKIGVKITGSTFDSTGRRHGAERLLNKGKLEYLDVVVNATVERILFSTNSRTAIGVRYTDSAGRSNSVYVTKQTGEVILSAGALGSPQLLLLSGIGPAAYLKSLNITVRYDQPNVGDFMADNPRSTIAFITSFPVESSPAQVVGIREDYYIESVTYKLSTSPIPFPFALLRNGASSNSTVATIVAKIPGPFSRGKLSLASSSTVKVGPRVRFNYFSNPTDLRRCVNVTKRIGDMLRTGYLDYYKYINFNPRDFFYLGAHPTNPSDESSIKEFCQSSVTSFFHYHGGCVMGRVVDYDFRVIGTNSLRVLDSSTFPISPGTNPQATLMMLGRYVGLKWLRERNLQNSVVGHEAY